MKRPDRGARWPRQLARTAGLGLLVALAACGARAPMVGGQAGSDAGPPALAAPNAVELIGQVRGPVAGLGDQAQLHVIVRGDGAVWASIRREARADGPAVHEVLVWADDLALLFDRRTLQSTELGEVPGVIDAWGGRFVPGDALWVLAGLRRTGPDSTTTWDRRRGEWRGRRAESGLRRAAAEPLAWTEAVWRDPDGRIHEIRVQAEAHRALTDGLDWPTRLGVQGTDLDARVVVDWDEVRWHPALGDSILDPLWEPPRP